jgi:hypothetical protein
VSEVMRCTDCGELFGFLARNLCGDCLRTRDEAFWRARDWFRANHGTSISAAAEALGIPVGMITGWVREGRLVLKADVNSGDADIAQIYAEKQRTDQLRKAFVESAGTRTPPVPKKDPSPSKNHTGNGGMYGRRNDA